MPTERQERLADAIIANTKAKKPKTKGELLEASGYSVSSSEASPGVIIEQKGVQEALAARGFTLDKAKEVVAEIMTNPDAKHKDRLTAADMTIKVHGGYAPEKSINVNMHADVKDFEAFDEISRKFDEEMKIKALE